MAGGVPSGQKLTPNPNVLAVAGMGGDVWGANGGGAIAIGGGVTDQTGYLKPVVITPSDCESATNFISTSQIPYTGTRLGRMNNTALLGSTADPGTVGGGGTNAG